MTQLMEFAENHPYLVGLFTTLLITYVVMEAWLQSSRKGVSPAEATRLINQQDAVVIDIRDVAEYKKGHILNARNIPLAQLDKQLEPLRANQDKPLVICCNTGVSAVAYANQLKKAGFNQVHVLQGGIAAWSEANLPLEKRK